MQKTIFDALLEHPRTSWQVGGSFIGGDGSKGKESGCAIMGIINCTPDSFFDGGKNQQLEAALASALQMVDEGARILDIGGESTRPGAREVDASEELERILPLVQALQQHPRRGEFFISVDTVKSEVAREVCKAGADIINDISALGDPEMAGVIAEYGVSVVLNHMQGTPRTMQQAPHYDNVLRDVRDSLEESASRLEKLGVASSKICLDPGIGFGKNQEHNLHLIRAVEFLGENGYPVLMGMSRKSYIGRIEGLENSDRLIPSVASALITDLCGAAVVRVHDVKATREALLLNWALRKSL
jgi:dihydropteroate synthase